MEDELRSHLLTLATAYAACRDLKLVTVARHAAGDWRFFDRIGSSPFTAKKYDQVVRWFGANWPEGLPWPADVPVPIQAEAAA